MNDIFFGRELKLLRLNEKHYGLKRFADLLGVKPSYLLKIEQGRIEPPKEEEWFNFIIEKLDIENNYDKCSYLKKLWLKAFVKQKCPYDKKHSFIPVFASDINGNPVDLDEKKIEEMREYLKKNGNVYDESIKKFRNKNRYK